LAQRIEERAYDARLHLAPEALEPREAVVVALVVLSELGGQLDADRERPFFAMHGHRPKSFIIHSSWPSSHPSRKRSASSSARSSGRGTSRRLCRSGGARAEAPRSAWGRARSGSRSRSAGSRRTRS